MSISIEEDQEIYRKVKAVLDEALSLGPSAYELRPESPLLGTIPELDSQAVLNVLVTLEEQFGIVFDDDDVDASAFDTLESLKGLVAGKIG